MAGTPKPRYESRYPDARTAEQKMADAVRDHPPPSSNVEMNSKGNTDTTDPQTYHSAGKSPNPWQTIVAYGLIGWLVVVSLGTQAVILLWSVRALGLELPFDLRRIAAIAALLFMFYGTLESQRRRWRK